MHLIVRTLAVLGLVASFSGCDANESSAKMCTKEAGTGLSLSVEFVDFDPDRDSDEAQVQNVVAGYTYTQDCKIRDVPTGATTRYVCTFEQVEGEGPNVVTVTLPGYGTKVETFDVPGDGCHADELEATMKVPRDAQ